MSTPPAGVGRLSTEPIQQGVASMCGVTECAHADLFLAVVLLCLTGAFLLVAGMALSRLREAREALAVELDRTRAERDAFEQFRRRVVQLDATDPGPPDPPSTNGGVLAAGGGSQIHSTALGDARDAYRETVMATAHFEEEYDETLAEHVAAEYTEGVAGALTSQGALTPELRATLASGAERAREQREALLADVEREVAAIEAAEETLAPAADAVADVTDRELKLAPYGDLVAEYERLEWHECEVETLLADRQSTVHDREEDQPHWYEYLYGDLQSPYPVVGAATDVLSELHAAFDELTSAAARRA